MAVTEDTPGQDRPGLRSLLDRGRAEVASTTASRPTAKPVTRPAGAGSRRRAGCEPADRTAARLPADSADATLPAEAKQSTDPAEPTLSRLPAQPTEPIDSTLPTEPTDSTLPTDPTERNE